MATQLSRRIAREYAGAHRTMPVVVVDSDEAPHIVGEAAYHTTPSGKTIVRHPNAYKWRTVYHCSTHRVRVGRGWLAQQPHTASRAA
jgi:hypothetical protein